MLAILATTAYAQDSIQINTSADVVTSFIFRGSNVGGNSMHIQPVVYADYKDFEVGAWGSYGTMNNYAEINLFASYTYKSFKFLFTNYNCPATTNYQTNSIFNKDLSLNFGEISVYYSYDKVPIKAMIATNIYGDNYHSTYIEMSTNLSYKELNLDLFVGANTYTSIYGTPGVVNVGGTLSRPLMISDKLTIPIKLTTVINPQANNIFFVFGITI